MFFHSLTEPENIKHMNVENSTCIWQIPPFRHFWFIVLFLSFLDIALWKDFKVLLFCSPIVRWNWMPGNLIYSKQCYKCESFRVSLWEDLPGTWLPFSSNSARIQNCVGLTSKLICGPGNSKRMTRNRPDIQNSLFFLWCIWKYLVITGREMLFSGKDTYCCWRGSPIPFPNSGISLWYVADLYWLNHNSVTIEKWHIVKSDL